MNFAKFMVNAPSGLVAERLYLPGAVRKNTPAGRAENPGLENVGIYTFRKMKYDHITILFIVTYEIFGQGGGVLGVLSEMFFSYWLLIT